MNIEEKLAAARRAMAFGREVRVTTAATLTFGTITSVDGLCVVFTDRGGQQKVLRPADILEIVVLQSSPPRGRKAASRGPGKTASTAAPRAPGTATRR